MDSEKTVLDGISFNNSSKYENLSVESLRKSILDHLHYLQARVPSLATGNDWYMALAYTIRERMLDHWIATLKKIHENGSRVICYLSAEFLLGPHLENHIINLGIYPEVEQAIRDLGLNPSTLFKQEEEPGLGNGGLGRLAACYLDSLTTLEIPAIGYGIRYEFGIFDQALQNGWQKEITDKWLQKGNPWEIPRPEISYYINLGGRTEWYRDEENRERMRWVPERVVKGVAYDTPISGYKAKTANLLRLWRSEAVESFDFQAFNTGDYYRAVEEKISSETISKVLYPNDEPKAGKILRLAQQYFFVSCSLQDMIRIHLLRGQTLDTLSGSFAAQMNDTHPSIAVAELMRLLMDIHGMEWERAWTITQSTLAFTNHTLLPEALEKWPLPLFARVLPRHLEIIFEINRRFLEEVRQKFPGEDGLLSRLSLIEEGGEKNIRMAHLACVGSFAINGVAALHSELLKKTVLRDFYRIFPDKFFNVTNGVTPRRWLVLSNPDLSTLITRKIGRGWPARLEEELKKLEDFAGDPAFQMEWRQIKRANKCRLAAIILERTGIVVNPDSLFDIQVKRLHEYKRQHLNLLHVLTLYNRLKENPELDIPARTVIFGGKAAPGYFKAKLIIKLINSVADVINQDPQVNEKLKVVFFPDFNVTNGQMIYPAADLSEQISTAGMEASGTGNMKFSLNGALTIGTLDGANVEIREEVGEDNFFLFGLTAQEVLQKRTYGYSSREVYESNAPLRQVLDQISSGIFSQGDRDIFRPLVESLLNVDFFMLLLDYQSYVDCQGQVGTVYQDVSQWTRKSILNVARTGKFSSDRSIREYCSKIWKVRPGQSE
jgi:glycogen phosphorylase